jgi:hypothetical protein
VFSCIEISVETHTDVDKVHPLDETFERIVLCVETNNSVRCPTARILIGRENKILVRRDAAVIGAIDAAPTGKRIMGLRA